MNAIEWVNKLIDKLEDSAEIDIMAGTYCPEEIDKNFKIDCDDECHVCWKKFKEYVLEDINGEKVK